MSTEVVNWQTEMANQAKAAAALERPSVGGISMKAGVMSYQGQAVPGNKLRCVVIASVFEHRWFKDRYDPNKPVPPDCFALSETGDDMMPHEDSSGKQHDDCAGCPMFAWGSDRNGGRGKECKDVRRLALIPVSSLETDAAKAEMAMLTVSVTNVKFWANYVNSIAAQHSRPCWGVITEIAVTPDAKTQFRISFNAVGLLDESLLAEAHRRIGPAMQILMAPYSPPEPKSEAQPEKSGKTKKY